MPEDKNKPKERTVRTRPANVIRAIVLSAAAAAAPAVLSTACVGETDYGAPLPDATQEDAGDGEATPADTLYGIPDASDVAEMTPPYGVPEYGVPDSVEYYGVPDGTGPDSAEDYGVPDGSADAEATDLLYGVPKPPAS